MRLATHLKSASLPRRLWIQATAGPAAASAPLGENSMQRKKDRAAQRRSVLLKNPSRLLLRLQAGSALVLEREIRRGRDRRGQFAARVMSIGRRTVR